MFRIALNASRKQKPKKYERSIEHLHAIWAKQPTVFFEIFSFCSAFFYANIIYVERNKPSEFMKIVSKTTTTKCINLFVIYTSLV